jgi:hypothetical protein
LAEGNRHALILDFLRDVNRGPHLNGLALEDLRGFDLRAPLRVPGPDLDVAAVLVEVHAVRVPRLALAHDVPFLALIRLPLLYRKQPSPGQQYRAPVQLE